MDRCEICHGETAFQHDHRADFTGLDDGPYLPGQAPRKHHEYAPELLYKYRRQAWQTRRAKYGQSGHR